VVVAIIREQHIPDRKVHRLGQRTSTPKIFLRPEYFHQPFIVIKAIIPITAPKAEMGSNVKEGIPAFIPGKRPFDTAFVKAL